MAAPRALPPPWLASVLSQGEVLVPSDAPLHARAADALAAFASARAAGDASALAMPRFVDQRRARLASSVRFGALASGLDAAFAAFSRIEGRLTPDHLCAVHALLGIVPRATFAPLVTSLAALSLSDGAAAGGAAAIPQADPLNPPPSALREAGVRVGSQAFCSAKDVRARLTALCDALAEGGALGPTSGVDPYIIAAAAFVELVGDIHPFRDGNGRLGRLLINWLLARAGLPFPLTLCTTMGARAAYVAALRGSLGSDRRVWAAMPVAIPIPPSPGPFAAFLAAAAVSAWGEYAQVSRVFNLADAELRALSALQVLPASARIGALAAQTFAARTQEQCVYCHFHSPSYSTLCCGAPLHLTCHVEFLEVVGVEAAVIARHRRCLRCDAHMEDDGDNPDGDASPTSAAEGAPPPDTAAATAVEGGGDASPAVSTAPTQEDLDALAAKHHLAPAALSVSSLRELVITGGSGSSGSEVPTATHARQKRIEARSMTCLFCLKGGCSIQLLCCQPQPYHAYCAAKWADQVSINDAAADRAGGGEAFQQVAGVGGGGVDAIGDIADAAVVAVADAGINAVVVPDAAVDAAVPDAADIDGDAFDFHVRGNIECPMCKDRLPEIFTRAQPPEDAAEEVETGEATREEDTTTTAEEYDTTVDLGCDAPEEDDGY